MEPTDHHPRPSALPPESGDAPSASPGPRPDLFSELKRRKVYRVGAAYLAVVFGALQGADLVFQALGLGGRVFNGLVVASLLGFPLALALAWMFDLTATGIRRTAPAEAGTWDIEAPDRWVRVKAALVGAGFVAVVWFGVQLWQAPLADGDGGAVPTERPVLAVLPFQDLSPEGDQEYFADGLHEELLHQLAAVGGLRLTSRTSLMHFRGTPSRIGAIADSLGARYVLEGSVRRAVDSVRVTVQLIDAETDEHLWSESYSRALSLDGLFDLQRTLAVRLARSLTGTLAPGPVEERLGAPPTKSLEAYNAYLRGVHHLHTFTRESLPEAAVDFKQAIALDPEFGRAHARLAWAYVIQNNLGLARRGELFPLIREHARLSLEYAPDEAESHMAQSAVFYTIEWNWEEARKEQERALELDPGNIDASWALAEWHAIVAGETERALEIIDAGLRIDPFSATAGIMRAAALHFARRYDEAAEEYRKLWSIDPTNATNTMNLVSNLALSGRIEEAHRLLTEALPTVRRTYGPTLAVHLARVGELEEARKVFEEVVARRDGGASIPAAAIAAAAAGVGEQDEALSWLERAFADEGGIYWLRDPLWDPIRGDPRFKALWDRVALPGALPPGAGS
ncbi:MAG TPA: hypothetical protein VLA36_00275 [Longimicrobiales bacterium]|nr:hypothetical protein [Longimicrobiales bacterium]